MCGRFAAWLEFSELRELMPGELIGRLDVPHGYNIAPSLTIQTAVLKDDGFHLTPMHWGLEPDWARSTLINAQAEKYLGGGRSFWKSLRRCVIPASGFYEWKGTGRGKQPMFIRRKGGKPIIFGGLYSVLENPDDGPPERCVIVTTKPNELVSDIHNRMPVLLRDEHVEPWGDEDVPREELEDAAEPYPSGALEAYPVSKAVNNVKNQGPELVEKEGDLFSG